jgi:hypothetical protein
MDFRVVVHRIWGAVVLLSYWVMEPGEAGVEVFGWEGGEDFEV